VTLLLPAAGQSRRMGQPKLLLPWGNGTVLDGTLAQVRAADVAEIIVVTGACRERVAKIAAAHGAQIVHNPAYAAGEMGSSVRVGVGAVSAETRAVLILPADMPLVQPATINQVIAAFVAGQGTIVAPVYGGQRGHPVLFGRCHIAALAALPPGSLPRDVVRHHRESVCLLPVDDPGVLIDLDDPQTYALAHAAAPPEPAQAPRAES
jgi:molybdenum cofactor cytidylyltransferase